MADFALEGALVVAGWWLLRTRTTLPRWTTSRAALAGLLAVQIVVETAGTMRGGVKPSACGGESSSLQRQQQVAGSR